MRHLCFGSYFQEHVRARAGVLAASGIRNRPTLYPTATPDDDLIGAVSWKGAASTAMSPSLFSREAFSHRRHSGPGLFTRVTAKGAGVLRTGLLTHVTGAPGKNKEELELVTRREWRAGGVGVGGGVVLAFSWKRKLTSRRHMPRMARKKKMDGVASRSHERGKTLSRKAP